MKRLSVTVILILLFIAIISSVAAYSWRVKRHKFDEAYAKLQVGDKRETVVQLLGSPEEIINCYDPKSENELDRKCGEEYWYLSFMERWIVSVAHLRCQPAILMLTAS